MRNRGFTLVAIATLAIGIATSTTVFSWIDAVLLRPLQGVTAPERLVAVETVTPNGAFVPNSYPDYRDFRDHLTLLDGIAVTHPVAFSVGKEDHAERVWGELVSGNFFAVLGAKAALGRVFLSCGIRRQAGSVSGCGDQQPLLAIPLRRRPEDRRQYDPRQPA